MKEELATRLASLSAEDLTKEVADDWGLFLSSRFSKQNYEKALKELNAAGEELVRALRDLVNSASGLQLEEAFKNLAIKRGKYRDLGAADTEGREATWAIVKAVLQNTEYDPREIWEEFFYDAPM